MVRNSNKSAYRFKMKVDQGKLVLAHEEEPTMENIYYIEMLIVVAKITSTKCVLKAIRKILLAVDVARCQ